jgi:hypothetical protein
VMFFNGDSYNHAKTFVFCVRAFRCVTYWYLYFDHIELQHTPYNTLIHNE